MAQGQVEAKSTGTTKPSDPPGLELSPLLGQNGRTRIPAFYISKHSQAWVFMLHSVVQRGMLAEFGVKNLS